MRPLALALLLLLGIAAGRDGAGATPRNPFLKGIALNELHPGHDADAYRRGLAAIRALGATSVLLPVYGYVDSAAAATVDTLFEPPVSAAAYRAFVRGLVRESHGAGLRVLLIPYLNVRRDDGVEWRGNLAPPDWERWFRSYDAWLGDWARLAREERVELLAVGAELVSSESQLELWRRTIRQARKAYPGRLLYSCNWDHYREVRFLDRLDAVGISAYYSLPWDAPTTLEAFRANWEEVRAELVEFARGTGRPLIFTEVGFPSVRGAYRDPWNYLAQGEPAPDEQAEALRVFVDVWREVPELSGAFVWCYSPFRGGRLDPSYSIHDKPAGEVVREWFAPQSPQVRQSRQERKP